ncbi:Trehalose-phosphate phosphatase [Hordeum vulgare]|nr:Trehalose-phosphate phosphatase [Hordeum vulgare]
MLAFQQAQEQQRCNLLFLEKNRPTEVHIDDKCTSVKDVEAMAAENPKFIAEQRAIYEAVHAQTTLARNMVLWRRGSRRPRTRTTPAPHPTRRRHTFGRHGGTTAVLMRPFSAWTSHPPAKARTPPRMSVVWEATRS